MKAIVILTILISSILAFLSSCRTGPEPRYYRSDKAAPTRGFPQAYYRENAEGRFYYADGPGTNIDYHPGVRRNLPVKRRY